MKAKINEMVNYGLIPSPYDGRDYQYSRIARYTAPSKLPRKFKLKCHPIREQGDSGTCVGFATARLQECDGFTRSEQEVLSPLYLYAKCKEADNLSGEGTTLRQAMKTLTTDGICTESMYNYIDNDNTRNLKFPTISQDIKEAALKRKTKGYARLYNLTDVKNAIYNENGALGGVVITTNFRDNKTGVVGTPDGYLLGSHAICFIGWDDDKVVEFTDGDGHTGKYTGVVYFANSWGTDWGDNGYGMIPYKFFDLHKTSTAFDIKLVDEAWTTFHYERGEGLDDPNFHKRFNGIDKVEPSPQPRPHIPDSNSPQVDTSKTLRIELVKDSTVMKVNGEGVTIPAGPKLISGSTFVPIRAISEAFGANVSWDGKTKTVTIDLNKESIMKKYK